MTFDLTVLRHKINNVLNTASEQELESLARIVAPDVPRYHLRKVGGKTAVIEVPAAIVEAVQRWIKTEYPGFGLEWEDERTPLQREVDERLARLKQ